jgi:Outer membrane protein beta-barrel domain
MQRLILAVLALSLAAANASQAQTRWAGAVPSSHWVLNAHSTAALGAGVGDAEGTLNTSSGLGGGVEVGYRITPRLTAYTGLDIAKQPLSQPGVNADFGLTHLEAGARLGFPLQRSRVMPYLGAWVGRRSLSTTAEDLDTGAQRKLSFSGLAFGGTAGVQVFVAPGLALDGGLSVGVGRMGTVKVDGQRQDVDTGTLKNTTTTRLRFGVSWYP